MPFEDQIKLLRVLDGDAITPIGATDGKKVDYPSSSSYQYGHSSEV